MKLKNNRKCCRTEHASPPSLGRYLAPIPLEVEVGTNGFKGGNASCGSRTYIRIKDLGGTDMFVKRFRAENGNTSEFEVYLGGDCELETMLRALKFVVKVLEEESKEVVD